MLTRALVALTGLVLAVAVLIAALTTAITAELTRLALPDPLLPNPTHNSDTNPGTAPGAPPHNRPAPNNRPGPGTTNPPRPPSPGGLPGASAPSAEALRDIPPAYLRLYQQAAAHACPGLGWNVLAAVGKSESDHGRSTLPGVAPGTVNSAGAGGPMQFLQPTFDAVIARHPPPPGGAHPPSRYNPHDAIFSAAAYLCDSGANRGDLRAALYTYNHDQRYVDQVLTQARRYTQPTPTRTTQNRCPLTPSTPPETNQPAPALTAAQFACNQLGKPYVWGGNGTPGFDCSGLVAAAYTAAKITLPRTAQTQYDAHPKLPAGTTPQPGDLIFFGTPTKIHHVGISIGGNLMIHAPDENQTVRIQDYHQLKDFAGITRPAS